jgi:hypothetical protein
MRSDSGADASTGRPEEEIRSYFAALKMVSPGLVDI